MSDVVVGVLAVLVGALFCFRGYFAMRVVIPVWGAFTGFTLGAGLVANLGSDGFLTTALGWVVGLAVAVLFAALAYLYYAVSVAVGMGAIGFVLGAGLVVALDVRWSWLVVAVGVIVGLVLATVAVLGDLPMVLLTVLTASAGSATVVTGIMLAVGAVDLAQLDGNDAVARFDDTPLWWALSAVLFVAGMVVQLRAISGMATTLREQWEADPSIRLST
jgi:hypothetical protein